MAPSLLQKLVKKTQFQFQFQFQLQIKSIIFTKSKQTHLPIPSLLTPHIPQNPNLYHQFQTTESLSLNPLPIFPSFPFGFCLNPVTSTGSLPDFVSGAEDGVISGENGLNPNLGFNKSVSVNWVPVFPSFPSGYCLNYVSANGSVPDLGCGVGDGEMMWADSVKKKRKKKMNKHKLKKLRKRLRRKTKT